MPGPDGGDAPLIGDVLMERPERVMGGLVAREVPGDVVPNAAPYLDPGLGTRCFPTGRGNATLPIMAT